MPNNTRYPSRKESSGPWFRLAGLGAELAGAVLGFTLIGLAIDRQFGSQPWGLLIGALLGLVGGLYNFFRTSLRILEQVDSQTKSADPPRSRKTTDEPNGGGLSSR